MYVVVFWIWYAVNNVGFEIAGLFVQTLVVAVIVVSNNPVDSSLIPLVLIPWVQQLPQASMDSLPP
jgi:hypothetical protein